MKLQRRESQPAGAMTPASQVNRIRQEINRILENPFSLMSAGEGFLEGWEPALDIHEHKDHITIRAELPGMKKEDISVSLDGNTLTIAGERKQEEEQQEGETFRSERYYGRFQRSIALPQSVDPNSVKASYKDGLLSITLPKAPEAQRKQIEIKAA